MVVSKKAVESYLSREMDDWSFIKNMSNEKIRHILNSFDPVPKFQVAKGLKPLRHQLDMFLLGLDLKECLFFADMGTSKTCTALNLIDYLIKSKRAKTALVCVPNVTMINHWYKEAKKHIPDLNVYPMYGTSKERLTAFCKEYPDVFVINYAGLVAIFRKSLPKERQKYNKKSTVDKVGVDILGDLFDIIVLDESHKVMNWKSLTYQICNLISAKCEYRYGLTGTPFGRDAQNIWAQFYCIDRGRTFGKTLGLFRSAFFKEKINHWGGYEYNLIKKMKPELYRFMKNRSIRYKASECLDLPEQIIVDIEVDMPKEFMDYNNDAIKDIIKASGELIETNNAYIRMREIASGYIGYTTETIKKKQFIYFDKNPKLEIMFELLEEIPENRKIIIFHDYIKTGEIITKALKKAKMDHVWLYGKTKDKVATLEKFTDGSCPILVSNVASGGTGLDLYMANYMIIFECPSSSIVYKQMLGRTMRTGQKHTVFVYRLIMNKSIDNKIIGFLKKGEDLFQQLVNGKIKWM